MKLTISINLDNSAFEQATFEDVVRDYIETIPVFDIHNIGTWDIRDTNGNKVGGVEIK